MLGGSGHSSDYTLKKKKKKKTSHNVETACGCHWHNYDQEKPEERSSYHSWTSTHSEVYASLSGTFLGGRVVNQCLEFRTSTFLGRSVVNQCLEFGTSTFLGGRVRYTSAWSLGQAPSLEEGCGTPVLGVWDKHLPCRENVVNQCLEFKDKHLLWRKCGDVPNTFFGGNDKHLLWRKGVVNRCLEFGTRTCFSSCSVAASVHPMMFNALPLR